MTASASPSLPRNRDELVEFVKAWEDEYGFFTGRYILLPREVELWLARDENWHFEKRKTLLGLEVIRDSSELAIGSELVWAAEEEELTAREAEYIWGRLEYLVARSENWVI